MELNYDQIILGSDIPITENVNIHVPTIGDLATGGDSEFRLYTQIFTISVREQFSGMPNEVDKIEEEYPTFWDMAFDNEFNQQIGESMFGEGNDLKSVIINGLAYWTQTESTTYRALSNKKIINESLNWIIDINEFNKICSYIKMATLSRPNEDLIAPKGISSKPHQCEIWKKLYAGRVRKLQNKPNQSLGDKILVLQAYAPGYVDFKDVKEMTYYQFANLLETYHKRYENEREFQIYTAYKFDTSKMKLNDLSEEISQIKIKK